MANTVMLLWLGGSTTMKRRKRIMILGASILQLPAILKAREMGHETFTVDKDTNAVGCKYADECLGISTNDIHNVFKAAKQLKIDGIMTLASDMPMRTVAYVSDKLGLTGISNETAIKVTDKVRMRDALLNAGVPIPDYYEIKDLETFIRKSKSFQNKFILKPTDSSGSRGICLIENHRDKIHLKNVFDYCMSYSKRRALIMEEYMEGPEVSVEALTYNGVSDILAITDKVTTGKPRFVEIGHSQPSTLLGEVKFDVENITQKAILAVGINSGPSHTEIIITKEGPRVIELGARMGGDNIATHLVPLSTGVDMVGACINIALGQPPDLYEKVNLGSAIRYLKTKPGCIKNIYGIEDAKAIDGIVEVYVDKSIGEKIEETENSSRIGYVIAKGENASGAVELCEKAISRIEIVLE